MGVRLVVSATFVGLIMLVTSVVQASYVDDSKVYQPRLFENRKVPLYKVPICWQSSGGDSLKSAVRYAVENTWEKHSSLDFTGWNICPNDIFHGIRIEHNIDPNGQDGVAAYTKGLGHETWRVLEPGMYLQFGKDRNCTRRFGLVQCTQAIAVHEFGHALGFWHEQGRVDTPSSCNSKRVFGGYASFTKYDAFSIMNDCNSNSKSYELTDLDILTVRAYYDNIPTYYETSATSDVESRTIVIPYLQMDGQAERYSATLVDSDGDGKFTLTQFVSATLSSKHTLSTYDSTTGLVDVPMVKKVNRYQNPSVYRAPIVNRIDGIYSAILKSTPDGQFQIQGATQLGQ